MTYTVTITSKGQITIPAKILKEKNLKKGQKLLFHVEDDRIFIETPEAMVNRLAGSIPIPKRFKGMPIQEIIEISKREYFANKIKKDKYLL